MSPLWGNNGPGPAPSPPSPAVETEKQLEILIRARYPLLYIVSWEEPRVMAALERIARSRNKRIFTWSITQGLLAAGQTGTSAEGARSLLSCLEQVLNSKDSAIYVLRDVHPYLDGADVVRKFRDVAQAIKASYNTVVILSSILKIPPELEKEVTVVDFPLPGYTEMDAVLQQLIDSVRGTPSIKIDLNAAHREKIIKAALGMTITEAENVFARAIVQNQRLGPDDISLVISEKEQIIRKSGILEYLPVQAQFRDVGGMDMLKGWLVKRSAAFTEKARAFGLPQPRGLLLLGVQGCGKSLCAKSISGLWNLPLLRLDVGRIFNMMQGASEENMRRAIATAESIAPCLFWVDEMEKGFSGLKGSGSADGGTTARVFATFLTWMQEKTKPVFVVATANDISQLPPEMLRKGRFDEIFFVDLPSSPERAEIIAIHLKGRGRDPRKFDIPRLVAVSEGFSGAEIEQAIVASMYDVFGLDTGRDITTDDVLQALKDIIPFSRTMAESLEGLRHWAATRARMASSHTEEFAAQVRANA